MSELAEELKEKLAEILKEESREDSQYDYVVLFSGGKDSFYLAHSLKEIRGSKGCLLVIDNGFEERLENVREKADALGMDLSMYRPVHARVKHFYRFLITEPALLEFDTNPLCFFCSRYFMSLGVAFAERHGIPSVIYGATPTQLKMREMKSSRDVALFNFMLAKRLSSMHKKIQEKAFYKNDALLREIFDRIFYVSGRARLIFPFQYLGYDVERIKEVLHREYDWESPVKEVPSELYLSSGCELVRLFKFFEEKFGMRYHELDQFSADYKRGIISKKTYDYNVKYFNRIMEYEKNPKAQELIERLGLPWPRERE